MITQEKRNLIEDSKCRSSELFIRRIESIETCNIVELILKKDILSSCKKMKEKEFNLIVNEPQNYYFEKLVISNERK